MCVFRRTTRWSCSRQFCLKVCIAWLTSLILVEFHLETHKFIRFFDKFQFSALDLVQNIEFKVTAPLDFFVDHHDFLTGANQSYQTGPMTHFELKCCIIFAHSVWMPFDTFLSKKLEIIDSFLDMAVAHTKVVFCWCCSRYVVLVCRVESVSSWVLSLWGWCFRILSTVVAQTLENKVFPDAETQRGSCACLGANDPQMLNWDWMTCCCLRQTADGRLLIDFQHLESGCCLRCVYNVHIKFKIWICMCTACQMSSCHTFFAKIRTHVLKFECKYHSISLWQSHTSKQNLIPQNIQQKGEIITQDIVVNASSSSFSMRILVIIHGAFSNSYLTSHFPLFTIIVSIH